MLADQRRALQRQHRTCIGNRAERRIIHAPQPVLRIKSARPANDRRIRSAVRPDDHLGRLPGGRELRRRAVAASRIARVGDRGFEPAHRPLDLRRRLVGGEPREPGLGRQFDVDRHPVGQPPRALEQRRIGLGDHLEVDIAAEIVALAQDPCGLDQLLHRVVGRLDDAGGEEQPLDVVAAVEREGELGDFLRGEPRALDVRVLAVDAIMAVEDAAVGQQDLEQRDAAPVGGIGVADAHSLGRADALAALAVALRGAGRGARRIVLGRVGENRKPVRERLAFHLFLICSCALQS